MPWTAAGAAVLGIVSGALPDLLKFFQARQDWKREREFMELQHRFQIERMEKQAGAKLDEADAGRVLEEVRAAREQAVAAIQAGARPSGVPWVDAFNSLIRPTVTIIVLMLFCVVSGAVGLTAIDLYRDGKPEAARALIDGAAVAMVPINFMVEAVVGYWFGARVREVFRRAKVEA